MGCDAHLPGVVVLILAMHTTRADEQYSHSINFIGHNGMTTVFMAIAKPFTNCTSVECVLMPRSYTCSQHVMVVIPRVQTNFYLLC